jgi:hypothetical protein
MSAGSGLPAHVVSWSVDHVQQWLKEHKSCGWDKYAEKFLEEQVDGRALIAALDNQSIWKVGILARGVRA